MAITINVTVSPILKGLTVDLYRMPYNSKVASDLTNSLGVANFAPAATSYPIILQVRIPGGQIINGITYEGAQSSEYDCYDGTVLNLTLTVTPAVYEGKAEIIEISLPAELTEGSYVEGFFRIKNVGTAVATIRSRLVTEWNGQQSLGPQYPLQPNEILRINLTAGGIVMPAQDAVITIYAQRLKDGVWVIDDTKSH